jgi:hypothetical protein
MDTAIPKRVGNVNIDKEKLKKAFDVSHFDINAVLRGVQLTLVGGLHLPCDRTKRPC